VNSPKISTLSIFLSQSLPSISYWMITFFVPSPSTNIEACFIKPGVALELVGSEFAGSIFYVSFLFVALSSLVILFGDALG
jgi:hypothetical protein